jgi:ABC-2 type transport system ATP-binding protein
MAVVIEIRDVTKYFTIERPLYERLLLPFGASGKICALDKISFSVKAGEILGISGSNGAGKTTLLRTIADLLKPENGDISILGRPLAAGSGWLRSEIGYVSSDERSFFWRLTGRENLEFFGQLYGLSAKESRNRTSQILGKFCFEKKAEQLFRDYSAGMRKKVAVMRALLHCPRIILLDEATNSLDLESAKIVKTLVREYVSSQKCRAAIWSTHRFEEIAEICDKVLVIEDGAVRFHGVPGDYQREEGMTIDSCQKIQKCS